MGRDTPLGQVYWIGGGPGAGKSTVARRLADRYGLDHYSTDDAMPDHARRSDPAGAPYLTAFIAMGMDERWVDRSPEMMLDTFHWFRGEGFDLVVDDLRRRSNGTGIVAGGFRLLPNLVKPWLADVRRAVWLLPTTAFRTAALESRGSTWAIAGRTRDPERARRHLAERDRLFVERLAAETARLGLTAIEVDTTMSEDELTDRVARAFGLAAG